MKGLGMPQWGKRVLLFAVPALVGAVVLAALRTHRSKPELTEGGATVPAARVITVRAMAVQPQAFGYGTAVPARIWDMVAETSGKAVVVHPRLKRGAIVPAGAVLVEIDPTGYKLRVAQLTAQTKSLEAQLEELALREKLDRAIWTTEQQSLELKERDVARQQVLLAQKVVPQSEFEKVKRDGLAQKLKTQTAAKAVQLVPFQRRMLQAGLAQAQAQLAEARNQLADTRITAPFECRIADVRIEQSQFVSKGQILAVADGIAVTEVAAQFAADDLRLVIGPGGTASLRERALREGLGQALGVSAMVRFRSGDFTAEWRAEFARISDVVDPQTRTMGVIVEVPQSYAQSLPGVRPPLVKGMYCEVELRGTPQPEQIAIPRHALRPDSSVLALDGEHRLRIRQVRVGWCQGNVAVIAEGLATGDILVVSDVVPAIEGMRLDPVSDDELAARLLAEAGGKGAKDD